MVNDPLSHDVSMLMSTPIVAETLYIKYQ